MNQMFVMLKLLNDRRMIDQKLINSMSGEMTEQVCRITGPKAGIGYFIMQYNALYHHEVSPHALALLHTSCFHPSP